MEDRVRVLAPFAVIAVVLQIATSVQATHAEDRSVATTELGPGQFVATGSLNFGRYEATTTKLRDGRILIAGGYGASSGATVIAEVYDPQSGLFSVTGALSGARLLAASALLPDGSVLISGGYEVGSTAKSSAERYDPATGLFTAVGNMAFPRSGHTATVLPGGRVLIAGGQGDCDVAVSAEIYDPATSAFEPIGNMNGGHVLHAAVALENGSVLLAGGIGCGGQFIDAEVYDDSTGMFSIVGSMTAVHDVFPIGNLLRDGRVLIAGGADENLNPQAIAEIFDPLSGQFTATGSMATPRMNATSAALFDGRVLVAGGYYNLVGGNFAATSSELFDPESGDFTAGPDMSVSRAYARAAVLNDGRVLIPGGDQGEGEHGESSVDLYLPDVLFSGSFD